MTRRPWLALVVLVLIGINTMMFVRSARTYRTDDDTAIAIGEDALPSERVTLAPAPVRVAILVEDPPLVAVVGNDDCILSIAPKTSPPRDERWLL